MTKSAADIEASALKFVNQTREYFGGTPLAALPEGARKDENDCVLQHSLCDLGLGRKIRIHRDRICGVSPAVAKELADVWGNPGRVRIKAELKPGQVPLPKTLRCFVHNFDSGAFPHLAIDQARRSQDATAQEPALALQQT
jgi:hypothetical protein